MDNPRARRGEDPLAELARLIGQEDPFAEFSGSSAQRRPAVNGTNSRYSRPVTVQPERRPDRQANGAYAREREADHVPSRPADTRNQTPRQPQPAARGSDERGAHREPDRYQPRTRTPQARGNGASHDYDQYDQAAPRARTNGRADAGQHYRSRDAYADEAPRQSRSAYAEEPRTARRAERYQQPEELPRHARSRQQAYQEPYNRGYEDDYDPDYADDAYLPEHADDIYGEVPRPRRSWGVYIVVGVVAVCLVAVAFLGVFAYRTIFNTPPRPALVTKSNAPTKVDPKAQQNAAAPNKTIQDRIGATGPEQVITREEQPADLTQQPNQQRALQFDPPPQQAPQPMQRPQQNMPAFAPPPNQQQPQQAINPDQPKKVRTMTVRSDGTVVPNTGPQQQQRVVPDSPGPLPLNANPNSLEPDTNVVPPTPRPNSNNNQTPQQRPQQQASLGPSTGNYVVQVASHKTQEEAQAAWNNLRQQYASIFNGHNANIRKFDLGDRGTFYRAMVGPLNRDQANALCQNLKTAGAGCIVQTR